MTLAEARKIVEEEGKCKSCKKEERMWSLNRVNIWVFVFNVANFSLDVTSVT